MKKTNFFLVPVSVHSIKSKKHEQFRWFKNKQPLLCAHLGWIKLRKLARKPQSCRSQESKSGFWSGGRVNSFSRLGLKEPDLPILLTGPGCPCASPMHSSAMHCLLGGRRWVCETNQIWFLLSEIQQWNGRIDMDVNTKYTDMYPPEMSARDYFRFFYASNWIPSSTPASACQQWCYCPFTCSDNWNYPWTIPLFRLS